MCGEAELWLRTAYPLLHQEYKQSTPSTPSMTSSTICLICLLRPHSGLHYGLHTCEGDKQFLKRTFHERIVYSRCLEEEGICPPRPRGWCQYCRLRRCLVSGVNLSLVRVGEARVRRGTKRTREQALSLSRNQVPPMYVTQPQQMMYHHQPYQVFVKNENDRFWLRPPGNPFPFFPPSSSAYLSSNLMAVSEARFPARSRTGFEPMTAGPRALQPHHRPWYVSPPRQSLPEKEPGHSEQWYMQEFANFMHLRRNEGQNMGELKRPNVESTVGMLSESQLPEYPQVSAEAYYVNAESIQSHEATSIVDPGNPCLELSRPFTIAEFTDAHQERAYFPKLDLINEGEVSTMKQNYVSQGEYSHGQEIKIERFKRHDSILSEEELARPPRTSSEKSYKEESSQLEEILQPIDLSSLCSPLDLSSVSSPIDLSSSSLPRPASVESFGPPRPLSTGSTGVSRPSSAGGSSRPPSLPGILEMSGNNKFSVNSAVLQDALEKVNISVANFANISNLSGVLEASI